ncbi:CPBP family glutamic-type intramembrane protease [Halopelagius longus]|uniref:CAAX protease self-immunity n=1 Tax=Halopelagius longus TaxID=1236180 RepID=A0A1H1EIR0_9EURY|nr:CPBP family intramembrane glutamic endopeptidase [Halopelagius longus]RDI73063.1 CPBP family intramembrane metalloprotease [Halopelagius longus]SDQ88617.1 CAAX protease self-immunity [Halopelagius longus]
MDASPVTLAGLVVALVGFELLDRAREALELTGDDELRDHLWKWVVPAVLLVVVALEGKTLASVGWRVGSAPEFLGDVAVGVAVMLGTNFLMAPVWARVGDGGESLLEGIRSFASLSIPERLFVAFTAGATEEFAFHGYAVERLLALTGSYPVAGFVSFAAFTLGHHGETWDRNAVVRIAQPALLTTLLYLWFRSLPVLVAVHTVNDVVGLLAVERYAPEDADDEKEEAAVVRWLGGDR